MVDETIAPRATVIGGDRYADDFTVISWLSANGELRRAAGVHTLPR